MTFPSTQKAAFALLSAHVAGEITVSKKAGQFCGQLCVDHTPLSPSQIDWLKKLLASNGLPPVDGGAHD